MNAADVLTALSTHYIGADGKGESHILIPEARMGAGFAGNAGRCDLVAIGTSPSRGMSVIGHEVKTSRQDWVRELKRPEKADWIFRYCDEFYLVVPSAYVTQIVRNDLPVGWGLMLASPSGCQVVTPGRRRTDGKEAVPWSMVVSWMADLDRKPKRDIARQLVAARAEGREIGLAQALDAQDRDTGRAERELASTRALLTDLADMFGVDLNDRRAWLVSEEAKIIARLIRDGGLSGLVRTLRTTRRTFTVQADALEALLDTIDPGGTL